MYSAIGVVTPPATLLSLDQVRRHIRIDTEDEDDLLEIYLGAATTMAEEFLARALVTQTLRWVMAHSPPTNQFPMFPFTAFILPLWMPYSMLFQRPVEIPRSPVQSIVSIATGQWGQADTVLDPSSYHLDLNTEPSRLHLLNGAGNFPSDHLIVEFVAGYADPASVPKPIVMAILLLTAFLYENRGDAGGDMPPAATALLWPYKIQTFGG
ncbi:hypothetical protein HN018_06865 [Lichenicola cladoniae]|uniref:Phage gp6-like head-tail connector protein n=1 Tax=Lichenicola cladoniae TaxID=1484109 RepID=A0A6M8HND7_9PROT|nr:head-tail connector protein [Lichenicola cladoniae]NPD67294.1 hypothetical protein [Acetobacteraceae bacterium]QKE89797.1 hypothetical protein HN018_06865 [Lichenicola cladoniae]